MPEFLLMGMEGERLRLFVEDNQILEEIASCLEEEGLINQKEKVRICLMDQKEIQ